MKTVTLHRKRQWADRTRAYSIKLNGETVVQMRANDTIELPIPDGAQTLTAHVDWCSSRELDVSVLSDGTKIAVHNAFSHKLWIPFIPVWYVLFKRNDYITLELDEAAVF